MALWRKNMAMSTAERNARKKDRDNEVIRKNSFYTGELGNRPNERIECADNRRAAGIYVRNY